MKRLASEICLCFDGKDGFRVASVLHCATIVQQLCNLFATLVQNSTDITTPHTHSLMTKIWILSLDLEDLGLDQWLLLILGFTPWVVLNGPQPRTIKT